jgi:hypothetical protein
MWGTFGYSMEAENTVRKEQFSSSACPDCGKQTGVVNLGTEPPREICGRFGCDWKGESLK